MTLLPPCHNMLDGKKVSDAATAQPPRRLNCPSVHPSVFRESFSLRLRLIRHFVFMATSPPPRSFSLARLSARLSSARPPLACGTGKRRNKTPIVPIHTSVRADE